MTKPVLRSRWIVAGLISFATISAAVVPAGAADGTFPWKAGDAPPAVAGLTLGETEQAARGSLGPPAGTSDMGSGHVLDYPASGLSVIATPADGVSVIRLRAPGAGSIDGVRVGDGVDAVVAKWGRPNETSGPAGLYNAGVWTVEIRLDAAGDKVADLILAWNTTKFPQMDPKKGTYYRPK